MLTVQERLVGHVAMQLSEGPLRRVPIRRRCLWLARLPCLRLVRSRMWVRSSNPMRLAGRCPRCCRLMQVVALLLQPSLSPRDHDQPSGRRASAFVLQALPQSRVVVCFGPCLFARKEGRIDSACPWPLPDTVGPHLPRRCADGVSGRGISHLHFQTHQQVELLAGLVVPELGRADARAPCWMSATWRA